MESYARIESSHQHFVFVTKPKILEGKFPTFFSKNRAPKLQLSFRENLCRHFRVNCIQLATNCIILFNRSNLDFMGESCRESPSPEDSNFANCTLFTKLYKTDFIASVQNRETQ